MTAQTKLGGLNREALLRLWFLFYVWALLDNFFGFGPHWSWLAWSLGSGLTCWLIYRRSMLAGIVGYLVSGTAAAVTLPLGLRILGRLLTGQWGWFADWSANGPGPTGVYYAFLPFVPTVVLVLHVASRHRLLRAFEDSVAEHRNGRRIAPSSYYLITQR